MCELLGMSTNEPTDICFSFSGLIPRGGSTGPHKDGWGICFYEGKGCRMFHDPQPSAQSEMAKFLKKYPIQSKLVISHIRKANRGRVCLENTHPFLRQLWGCNWTFAHNGQLKGIKKWPLREYFPIGTTDSEHAFCWLLDQIEKKFKSTAPKDRELWAFIEKCCKKIATLGVFNILMSDSKNLYGFCSTKMVWITRKAPFGKAHLVDEDLTLDYQEHSAPTDIITVVATAPLTKNETWQKAQKGQFLVFNNGQLKKIPTTK